VSTTFVVDVTTTTSLAPWPPSHCHPAGGAAMNFTILARWRLLTARLVSSQRSRPLGRREFVTDYVLEGASACRRDAFLASGGYWPRLIGHEGWDLAMRLLDAGHDLVYSPASACVTWWTRRCVLQPDLLTFTRNAIWVACAPPAGAALATIAKDLALMGFASARAGHLRRSHAGSWTRRGTRSGAADAAGDVGETARASGRSAPSSLDRLPAGATPANAD